MWNFQNKEEEEVNKSSQHFIFYFYRNELFKVID